MAVRVAQTHASAFSAPLREALSTYAKHRCALPRSLLTLGEWYLEHVLYFPVLCDDLDINLSKLR